MTLDHHNLANLIQAHQASTGDSYNDIAKRSGLSKAKIGQLAIATQPHMPRTQTIQKLAAGLQLPVDLVQRAALRSAGIIPPVADEISEVDVLTAKIRLLSDRDRAIVMRTVDSLIAEA